MHIKKPIAETNRRLVCRNFNSKCKPLLPKLRTSAIFKFLNKNTGLGLPTPNGPRAKISSANDKLISSIANSASATIFSIFSSRDTFSQAPNNLTANSSCLAKTREKPPAMTCPPKSIKKSGPTAVISSTTLIVPSERQEPLISPLPF